MEVLTLAETREKRRVFFLQVYGKNSGYVCLSHMSSTKGRRSWTDDFYRYPEDLDVMLDDIDRLQLGHNIYYSPMLYAERTRAKQHVTTTPVIWADLDTCDPDAMFVKPTISIESSPGRYQAYWIMDEPVDPDDAENLARRIAYRHADEGADRSGWDLTQVLRVPFTYNYKYGATNQFPTVKILDINRSRYRLKDFEEDYPEVAGYIYVDEPMPDLKSLEVAEDILQRRRLELNPVIWRLYNEEPAEDWSKPLWNLQMLLFETGFSREEVFSICLEAKCNKYSRDGKPLQLLWKEVCRSSVRNEQNQLLLMKGKATEEDPEEPLLSEEEKNSVLRAPDTFIERYQEWARSLGDAAPQYHQAGAFVALSSLLAGRVRLPTSFGTIMPNLWFMILADTTLTRKTTAMDIAMDMVTEIDPDCLLATDGSIEGLLGSLATRPGKPSVFLRDEFSGLLEMITKKDYYAGMPEALTKLYDGKMQKRVLRKEVIEVRDPCLIFFAGGIKNKITQLLNHEHVSSGFMPRFIFITAESDLSRLKPLGPPSEKTKNNGEAIRNELTDIFEHYNRTIQMTIAKLKAKQEAPKIFEAQLTDDAWVRYNKLESQMLELGLASEKPDIMTPTYDRLSKSILKAAVLLSATRQRSDEVIVEEQDILRAIFYGEQWKIFAEEIMANIGRGAVERQLELIRKAVDRNPGITRSQIMRNYHLTAKDASAIFETLEQRGQITRRRTGKTEQFFT